MTLEEYKKKYNKTISKQPSSLQQYKDKYSIKTSPSIGGTLKGTGLNIARGLGKGIESISDLGLYGLSKLTGNDKYALNAKANTTDYILDKLAGYNTRMTSDDSSLYLTKDIDPFSAVKTTNLGGQVAQGIGQMIPSILSGSLISSPKKAIALAKLISSAQAGSSGLTEGFSETGNIGLGELGYGALQGLGAFLIEGSKFPGLGQLKGNTKKEIILNYLKQIGAEGAEEGFQELLTPAMQSTYKGIDAFKQYASGDTYKNIGQSALVGGITGGIMDIPKLKSGLNNLDTKKAPESRYENVLKKEAEFNAQKEESKKKAEDSLQIKERPNIVEVPKSDVDNVTNKKPKTISKEQHEAKKISKLEDLEQKNLTKEQSEKISKLDKELKNYKPMGGDKQTNEKYKKAKAMEIGAEKRKIIQGESLKPVEGGLTSKELAKKEVTKVDEFDTESSEQKEVNKLIKDKKLDEARNKVEEYRKKDILLDTSKLDEAETKLKTSKIEAEEKARVKKEKEEIKKHKENKKQINDLVKSFKETDNLEDIKKAMEIEKNADDVFDTSPKEIYEKYLDKKISESSKKETKKTSPEQIKKGLDDTEVSDIIKKDADFEAFKNELSKPFAERFKTDEGKRINEKFRMSSRFKKDADILMKKANELARGTSEFKEVDLDKSPKTIEEKEALLGLNKEVKATLVNETTLAKKELEVQKALKDKLKDANTLYEEYKDMGGDMSKQELIDTELESIVDEDETSKSQTFETIKDNLKKVTLKINEDLNTRVTVGKKQAQNEGKLLGKNPKEFSEYLSNKIENNIQTDYKDVAALTEALNNVEDQQTYDDLVSSAVVMVGDNARSLSLWGHLMKEINNTPTGKKLALEKTLKSIENNPKYKVSGDMTLTEADIKELNSVPKNEDGSFNQDALDEVVSKITKEKMANVEGTIWTKLTAWRKFAMLTNPATHVRNIVSNVMSSTMLKSSKYVSGIVQDINAKNIMARGEYLTETRLKPTNEVKSFAEAKTNEFVDKISSKYIENKKVDTIKVFGKNLFEAGDLNKIAGKGGAKFGDYVQTAADLNYNLMAMEDNVFKKNIFSTSLSKYLAANGITTQAQIDQNPHFIDTAVEYATNMGLYGTYQQDCELSDNLNKLKYKGGAFGKILDIIFPFTKTPINVAKEAVDYSPIGLMKTLTKNSFDLSSGKIKSTDYINNITKGMTGSMVFALGAYLAKQGLLKIKATEDEKNMGIQDYSINVGGNSYSIDWAMPVAMPLVWGGSFESVMNENMTPEDAFNQLYEPFSNLTVLSNFENVINNYKYDGPVGVVKGFISNYMSQYVPAISGSIAKTIDKTERKVGGSPVNAVLNKIPFATYLLDPKLDLYGNELQRSDNVVRRAYDTFISPYKKKEIKSDYITNELQTLYGETKEDSVLPPNINTTKLTYKDEEYEISDEASYKKTFGNTVSEQLNKLFNTTMYKNSNNEDKAKLVKAVYDFGKENAKKYELEKQGVEYTNRTDDEEKYYQEPAIYYAIEKNISLKSAEYYRENPVRYTTISSITDYDTFKTYSKELDKIRDNYKSTKDKKAVTLQYINNLKGLSKAQKAIMYKLYYSYTNDNSNIYKYIKNSNYSTEDKKTILKYLEIIK